MESLLHSSPSPPLAATPRRKPGSVNLPYFVPHSSRILTRTATQPPSPSTPTTPTESTFYTTLSTSTHEPWILRVANRRSTPRSRIRRALSPGRIKQTDEDCETLVEGESSSSSENSTELVRMSVSGAMKRKVVIMGSPSVGESFSTPPLIRT